MMAFTVELSMVLVLIPRIIFSFCEMDFIDYLVTYGGIHEYFWQENLNHWWYSWNSVKKNWNFSGGRLGLWSSVPASDPASAPALGPSRQPEKFSFSFLPNIMKPPMVSFFLAKKYSWNHQKWPNKSMKPGHKKIARFLYKTNPFLLLNLFKL